MRFLAPLSAGGKGRNMNSDRSEINGIHLETTLRELSVLFANCSPPERLPSAKRLRSEGHAVFSLHGRDNQLTLYSEGLFIYSSGGHTTVQKIDRCFLPFKYDFNSGLADEFSNIGMEVFMELPFYIRLVMEGEQRLASNLFDKERKHIYSYDNIADSCDLEEQDSDFSVAVIDNMAKEQICHNIQEALLTLTEKQRKVIDYCYYQGMTQQQAADLLHCKRQTINECLKRAIYKLRTYLTNQNI